MALPHYMPQSAHVHGTMANQQQDSSWANWCEPPVPVPCNHNQPSPAVIVPAPMPPGQHPNPEAQ